MATYIRATFGAIIIAFLLLVYWYQSGAMLCPAPIAYRLGSIDPRFSLSEQVVLSHIAEAEAIWEEMAGRELFVYDSNANFPINFIFDKRQAEANAEERDRTTLDAKEEKNADLIAQIERLRDEYETLVASHEARVREYESVLATYNAEVAKHNAHGGAPSEVFAQLTKKQRSLDQQVGELNSEATQIRQLAKQLNELSAEANERIENYNQEVYVYNDRYGDQSEITQGDYQGKQINIYKFSDDDELVAVLAHEFGHALGIGHVEKEGSLMYYLLEEPSRVRALSEDDTVAFVAVCGKDESFGQRLRRMIREMFI